MVGRPSQWAGSGREALMEDREWSVGPPEGLEMVCRPSRRAGSGREDITEGH